MILDWTILTGSFFSILFPSFLYQCYPVHIVVHIILFLVALAPKTAEYALQHAAIYVYETVSGRRS